MPAVSPAYVTTLPPLCGRREARRRSRARPGDLSLCRRGSLRIIAAITQESVSTRILRHLKLASLPPPIAPARCRQERFAFDSSTTRGGVSQATCAQQQGISSLCVLTSHVKSSLPDRPSRGPRTGQPLSPQPHASSATCPDRAVPRYALLRAAGAGHRWALGTPPAPRARGGRWRRRAAGRAGRKGVSFSYPSSARQSSPQLTGQFL
jgi:hypothetical protein